MDRLRELSKQAWSKYRGLPMWGQIAIGVVALSVIVGPFLSEDEDASVESADLTATSTTEAKTSTTENAPTTTAKPSTTTTEAPPTLEERIEASNDGTLSISANDLGDEWPLSVDSGVLSCLPGQAVVFGAEDTVFAVNGTARGRAEENGWREIDEIWLDNPELEGTKINIGPLIDIGLQLCD